MLHSNLWKVLLPLFLQSYSKSCHTDMHNAGDWNCFVVIYVCVWKLCLITQKVAIVAQRGREEVVTHQLTVYTDSTQVHSVSLSRLKYKRLSPTVLYTWNTCMFSLWGWVALMCMGCWGDTCSQYNWVWPGGTTCQPCQGSANMKHSWQTQHIK